MQIFLSVFATFKSKVGFKFKECKLRWFHFLAIAVQVCDLNEKLWYITCTTHQVPPRVSMVFLCVVFDSK